MSLEVETRLQLVGLLLMCAALLKLLLAEWLSLYASHWMKSLVKKCRVAMEPGLVDIRLHFVLGHSFFGVLVALAHLTNKVEGFGFFQDDDIGVLALLLLFVDLTTKGDDVGGQGDPCLIERLVALVRSFVMTLHQLVQRCVRSVLMV
jgi:hypothetical protein